MGVMRDELRERLADAAKFLRRCRGTEPVEFFEEHATACEEAAALLVPQEAPPILSRKHANEIAYFLRRPDMAHDARRERLASLVERAVAAPQEAREGEPHGVEARDALGVEKLMSELARIARLFRSASELGSAVLVPIAADIDNARATIKALAAARPAPEAREPEVLGYVVERQRTPGEWVRVWTGRTLWFDHDEAVLERDAYALDGIPARIRPVYLGAPAPERSES